jgi:hypothetical protein
MFKRMSVLPRSVRKFAGDECGAVTVDWVVLTASIMFMVLTLFTILTETIFEDVAVAINEDIEAAGSR